MQNNKLRMAIRATAAVAAFGMAAQASAIELNVGEYEANLYGFARAVASYDINEDVANGGQAGNFAAVNTSGEDGAEGHFGIDAKTSRLGLSVVSPEGVKAVVEYDFDRDNSLTPRLRLAYGEYKGVLIGQNWSNYNSFVGNTSILDFDGLPGAAGTQGRSGQIRYTTGPMSFSIEEQASNDIADGLDTDGDTEVSEDNKQSIPVFTARFEDSQGGLSYSAAAMAKQVTVDDGSNDDSAMGYGAFLAGKVAITDMISIQGAVNYADGASGYVYRTGNNGFWGYDAYTDGDEIETIEAYGGTIGASFNLGQGSSVNVAYGIAKQDIDDAVEDGAASGGDSESNSMAAVNYQWTPVENVKMGVEYAHLQRDNQDGSDGDANRLMFLAQYNF